MSNLATALLGRRLACRSLAGRSLVGCLLGGGLLGRRLLCNGLLGGAALDCLLGGAALDCLLGGAALDCLLGGAALDCLLGGAAPDCLLGGRLLHRLPGGATRRYATFHCWSFRREALCARDNRFELRAGPKGRHGGGLNFDRLAGARIPRDAGGATALLENAEAGNGDAVTLVHRTHDGVDDILHRRSCLPTIRAQFLREYVDELRFVHAKPPNTSGPSWTDYRTR